MMKSFFILLLLLSTTILNAQIDYYKAKLYKDDINSKVAYEMQQNGVLVIDVRTKKEFATSRAKNSINIPLMFEKEGKRIFNQEFVKNIYDAINGKMNTEIILICRSGSRTKLASNILASEGFTNVYNIQKGFSFDWIKENLPIEK